MTKTRSLASLEFTGAGNTNELPGNFPKGLRVLVVDDDQTCLKIIDKKLKECNYEVTLCNKAAHAIAMLRENKKVFDVVLTDVLMTGMDGFRLLQLIRLEMDHIPVVMMSVDDSPSVMRKAIDQGACDYLIKPISMEVLRSLWLNVVRSQKQKCQCQSERQLALVVHEEANQTQQLIEYAGYTSPENERRKGKMVMKRRRDKEAEYEDPGESSSAKKQRVVWTLELHQRFVEAVNILSLERAVPKKILEIMGIPGITRENIASHLQKYRLYLKRMKDMHPNDIDAAFMDFLSRGYELQGLQGKGQFQPFQTSFIDRLSTSSSSAPMSGPSQRFSFLFEDPRFLVNPVNAEQNQYLITNTPSNQYSFNDVNSQALVPMPDPSLGQALVPMPDPSLGQALVPMPDPSLGQNLFSNGMLANGLGTDVSGSGIGPSYNGYGSNQMNLDPVPQNMTFTDWMTYPTSPTMGPGTSFALEGNGTQGDNTGDNPNDLLNSLLEQTTQGFAQMGNDLAFDGYDFDDLPGAN